MTVAKLISGIIAIFRLQRMLMSVTVVSHMTYDSVALWLDCPFDFHFARKSYFICCVQERSASQYIDMYWLNSLWSPFFFFGNSFRFFISALHQNKCYIAGIWWNVGCTCSHFFYATHTNTHINNRRCFFLLLTLLVIENSVCMLVQRCIIFPGWRQKLKAMWFWWRALAMPLRLLRCV